jgi:hypothetical protein
MTVRRWGALPAAAVIAAAGLAAALASPGPALARSRCASA